jgi:hypothetical protein
VPSRSLHHYIRPYVVNNLFLSLKQSNLLRRASQQWTLLSFLRKMKEAGHRIAFTNAALLSQIELEPLIENLTALVNLAISGILTVKSCTKLSSEEGAGKNVRFKMKSASLTEGCKLANFDRSCHVSVSSACLAAPSKFHPATLARGYTTKSILKSLSVLITPAVRPRCF